MYKKIEQSHGIRLLELASGSASDPLKGELRHTRLDATGDYEAVSYVWGSDLKCHLLEITGSEGAIPITASLYSVLKQLRSPLVPRTLWVDALCINQDDNIEKSAQVRLMYDIYSQATKVVAYLGDEAEDSHLVPPLLERLADRILFDQGQAGSLARSRLKSEDLQPVAALMRRPWFRRAWIIQEFLAAQDILMVCGSWEVHWRTLYQAVDNTYSFDGLSLSSPSLNDWDKSKSRLTSKSCIVFSTLEMGRDRKDPNGSNSRVYSSLLDLFDLFQDKEATRKRDHLFALLSLASDVDDSAFDPDYVEPLEAIVRRYADAFIRQNKCFHLLASAGLSSQPTRFPSWIPDWTTQRDCRWSEGLADNMATYKAAASTDLAALFDKADDVLVIKGIFFDQIAQLLRPWSEGAESSVLSDERQASYLRQCDELSRSRRCYPTGENPFDVLWQTLIAGRDQDGQELNDSTSRIMKLSYLAFRKECKVPTDYARDDTSDSSFVQEHISTDSENREELSTQDADSYTFDSVFFPLTHQYTVCLTERGYLGLAPKNAKIKDWACVVYGCPVPFVIRRSEGREGALYQLIGKSYVHGIMNGEALLGESFKEEDIRLH